MAPGKCDCVWLLDLTSAALLQDPNLSKFAGRVSDSGEGRWTIKAAVDEGVPATVLTTALYERFSSRGESDFANKLLSAMRYQFGGTWRKPRRNPKLLEANAAWRVVNLLCGPFVQSRTNMRGSLEPTRSREAMDV